MTLYTPTRLPVPESIKQPHSIMLPPPYLIWKLWMKASMYIIRLKNMLPKLTFM